IRGVEKAGAIAAHPADEHSDARFKEQSPCPKQIILPPPLLTSLVAPTLHLLHPPSAAPEASPPSPARISPSSLTPRACGRRRSGESSTTSAPGTIPNVP